ncbi:DNA double-strand break repair protein Mre11 [Halovivax gelatinilyticus]|uniref:DNA double-strand break repair protein Mre11 n=1 Tax=Halovivax gelatinilyticus TaxID=2961597 RepID=UPI0020CA58CF|nr:DNA double-strand break repair protein Mre11 [Halovivax gelatinilyticus]
MTRVIHTGDTHIGYQQYNSPDRRRDFLRAFEAVASAAIDGDVDAVVHAGDLFHDRRPGLVDLQGTIDVLRRLADADVPFLAIVGNHETKRDAQWLDLFEDLDLATRLGPDPVVVGDVAFYGLDFVPRSRREHLNYEFDEAPADVSGTALVAHGLFEPFAHADWDTEAVLSESTVDFDAMLLGDNHAPDTATVADTWVTYCGSTERASASERDPRGYNLVTFEDEVSITRRALEDTRDFVFVDVELEPGEGVDRVRERLGQHDLSETVTIVTIEGDGEPVSPATVEAFAFERDALVARANDRRDLAEDATEHQVTFADPDSAVTDRLRELDCSDGALAIDATVRDETVADSNVRESVERTVRDALTQSGLSFVDVHEMLDDDSPTVTEPAGAETAPSDSASEGDPDEQTDPPNPDRPDAEGEPTTGSDGSTRPAADADPVEPTDGDGDGDSPTDGSSRNEDDGQVSIGDFS